MSRTDPRKAAAPSRRAPEEAAAPPRPRPSGTSALGAPVHAGFAGWRAAMQWQRTVGRALRPLRLTPTQLLVLDATQVAQDPDWDGVPQSAIARAAGLDHATTSAVLRALEDRQLVQRGEGADGRSLGVSLSREGRRLLVAAASLLEQGSVGRPSRR